MGVNMSVFLFDTHIAHPIMVASGPWSETRFQMRELVDNGASAVVSKSCTYHMRPGNKGSTVMKTQGYTINAIGLRNGGISEYLNVELSVPYIVSLYPDTHIDVVGLFQRQNVFAIELNISCPNDPEKRHYLQYDLEKLDELLTEIFIDNCFEKPLGLKIGYMPLHLLEKLCVIIKKHNISFVTCVNSIPGFALDTKTESTLIKAGGGVGGISGSIKPFGLYMVKNLRELLGDDIVIFGCGGISSGSDVFEYILAGATAVQVGSACAQIKIEDIRCDFEKIVKDKNFQKLSDFRGQYKS